jgi:hypothetical protein
MTGNYHELDGVCYVEPVDNILEPEPEAWEATILPLNYCRD